MAKNTTPFPIQKEKEKRQRNKRNCSGLTAFKSLKQ